MTAGREAIVESWLRMRGFIAGMRSTPQAATAEQPLRSELFSSDQMERHGRVLARSHKVADGRSHDLLLARLSANEALLHRACDLLSEAVTAKRRITPAAEWLLDNFHLVEEQVRLAKQHLPKDYSRELPRLVDGPSAGLPRVYDIALETIAHGDGRVDAVSLIRFIASYQSIASLKLGELWAIPIMLRLALIENLRRVGARLIVDRIDRNLADHWASKMTRTAENDPRGLVLVIADMARSEPPQTSSFVAELARRLQGRGATLALPLGWIEQWLGESGRTIEHMVQVENQQQAADQVSISNSIGSLRHLTAMDWREFVETLSVVEVALRDDPAGVHARMDFATRDRYRHVVERLARHAPASEEDIARRAVGLARAGVAEHGHESIQAHVGHYLVGEGALQLERETGFRRPWHARARLRRPLPTWIFLGPVGIGTALFALALLWQLHAAGWRVWLLWLLVLPCLLAASELAIALANWTATLLVTPLPLPRLDYSEGLPSEARTLVVVPGMLGSVQAVAELADGLEVRFLANRGPHLHFALLTDFLDAGEADTPADAEILAAAVARIAALNCSHADASGEDRFFLLHRPRTWNPAEGAWMGRERKRGKLADLNALLRGGERSAFCRIEGDIEPLHKVRYVITLDTDTQLPRDAVTGFVSTLAHPLNRARMDPVTGCVAAGHGILQPRVGTSIPGKPRSPYARWMSSEPGIDPYTRAVSDVYQDLFDQGSFIGKGVYDVEAFERALEGHFPDNAVLSHDLLEGCYARSGLMSDELVFEDYPSSYAADVARRHRWIRGDWQLLPWLRRRSPRADGSRERNPLSTLSHWKLLDNLRRSLVSTALLSLFVAGWLWLDRAWWWTLSVLAVVAAVPLASQLAGLLRKPGELPLGAHIAGQGEAASRSTARFLLQLACLPHDAWFSLDAIARTLWRMTVSRRHLLQWNPSSEVERTQRHDLGASLRAMWFAPACAIAVSAIVARGHAETFAVAAPILCLWLLAPLLAWQVSRAPARTAAALDDVQRRFLGRLARRTWAFFEDLVGADDHWLPPDNVQEQPISVVAHRTSPTNIGLSLLANLAACDLGYAGVATVIERSEQTLATLASLPRYRGHFLNWYDTRTLQPLSPRYVSSVDSGNLAGHLLVFAEGIAALPDAPILHPRTWDGLADTFGLLGEQCVGLAAATDTQAAFGAALVAARAQDHDLRSAHLALRQLLAAAKRLRDRVPTPAGERDWARALAEQCEEAVFWLGSCAPWLESDEPPPETIPPMPSLRDLAGCLSPALASRAADRIAHLVRIEHQARELAEMDYDFLYDRSRHLLSIGYNVDERRLDDSYYDLLASEARLCVFVAIAQGKIAQESWFALGRQLSANGGDPVLLSWSGSMFEYLMPELVMPGYEGTLLDETMRAAVERQIAYGRQRGVPWGFSESGYNTFDAHLNYQYRAFGVPGLGLKRGLAQDLVVAPYASALALLVLPEAACANLRRLVEAGYGGAYGLHEAIDFTPSRLPRGQSEAVVRSFMAHHQGMSLLAFAHVLHDRPMQKRFEANREFQSALLLLQERMPRTAAIVPHAAESPSQALSADPTETRLRIFERPDTPTPAVQMLSNGRYSVMVTHAGGGYSSLREIAVTRWREDATRDASGSFCYVRDLDNGAFWSTSHQPVRAAVERQEAIFSDVRAEFRCRKGGIDTHAEIVVSSEDDIELRRVTVTNRSRTRRTIELTSYAEVVLAPAATDAAHPAFGNLFVQSELARDKQAILCHRRPQSGQDPVKWMFHMLAMHGADIQAISYETDRAKFIGRTRDLARPLAMDVATLSDSEGSVLDPIVAIRARMTLEPDQVAVVDFVTGAVDDRGACLRLVEKYRDRRLADRVFDLAWTHSQVVRQQINASQSDAQLYERLAGSILHANPALRAEAAILARNRRGQSGLWGYSISGDLPIVLVQIADPANIDLVRQLVQAHAYWRLKGLAVDLVIWNEDHGGYRQALQEEVMGLIAAGHEANTIDKSGGIFVRASQQMGTEDRVLMLSVARIVLSDARGTLAEQVVAQKRSPPPPARFVPVATARPPALPVPATAATATLRHANGLGGFSEDGSEYVITLEAGQATPAPWCNVLANAELGSVVSESGAGYTWFGNAHEFRLTPWHNDPVSDPCGEAWYLRDEDSGHAWSPTPLPRRGEGTYRVRHGFGYTVHEHVEDGIASELWLFVAVNAPVKYAMLKLRNLSGRSRRISAIGYVEWVLGDLRTKGLMHVVTEQDAATGAVLARNAYNADFGDHVAFFDVNERRRSVTGDRTEFIGRNGSLRAPAALERVQLSDRVGPGMDPCGAIGITIPLIDEVEHTTVFRLGAAQDEGRAHALLAAPRDTAAAQRALDAVRAYWTRTLGVVRVRTPDPSVDVLANGWLLYQVIASRFLGRSGYYQSGGAWGFRDQLQDSMAMLHAEPALVREHLLRCAAHQFREGDVLHWWHPPQGRGVRTRCSDDYLWLPYTALRYVEVTADNGVLDATAGQIEGRPLNPGEESWYDLPARSPESPTLYEHCVHAIEHALNQRGANGLPLMGSGDWNDGMNHVGIEGKGESVWLGFFLFDVLRRFGTLALARGDEVFGVHCHDAAEALRSAIETSAWDGAWYRRAWFDDGTPLGTAGQRECAIDSIAQSWSVLSGAGDPQRMRQAMQSVDEHLVRRDARIVQLLDPPFDREAAHEGDYHDPGYIAAYVPGVRENGGQYTHAAAWAAIAFAELGETAKAWELLGLINPVHHGNTAESIARYKVEPYVMAADVYARAPHTGRGGWTWYTGSAGWTYRLIVETLLGVQREGQRLRITPRMPDPWDGYAIDYREGRSTWHIEISRGEEGEANASSHAETLTTVDGRRIEGAIELVDDASEHRVVVTVPRSGSAGSTAISGPAAA